MFKENVRVFDEANVNGKLVHTPHQADIIGEVEVIYESKTDGKAIFTRTIRRNELLVTGAVFMQEKINNERSTFTTVPLDLELGVHTADEINVVQDTIGNELICGVMVGNGGCADTYNMVYKVNRAARSVPGPIPFRVVPVDNDLRESERVKYIMRAVKGDYVYYYGKTFDIARKINVQYEDGTMVPTDVDTTVVTKFIKCFTEYRCTVEGSDIREYFKITNGSTLRSLINSIGLITGYPGTGVDGHTEYFNVRGLTALNMENQELKDSESTITVIYRLFIQ